MIKMAVERPLSDDRSRRFRKIELRKFAAAGFGGERGAVGFIQPDDVRAELPADFAFFGAAHFRALLRRDFPDESALSMRQIDDMEAAVFLPAQLQRRPHDGAEIIGMRIDEINMFHRFHLLPVSGVPCFQRTIS